MHTLRFCGPACALTRRATSWRKSRADLSQRAPADSSAGAGEVNTPSVDSKRKIYPISASTLPISLVS